MTFTLVIKRNLSEASPDLQIREGEGGGHPTTTTNALIA